MEFRRSGTADERRRKMLVDEPTAQRMLAPSADHPTNTARKSDAIARAYAAAAHDETEARVADLIPTRPLGVVVFALLGLCAVAAVELAYTFLPDWLAVFGARGGEVLDLTSRGSLAAWLSSVLLGTSALTAVLVYAIRRHKMDDYRGRYRLWLWCAAALMIASVNAVAGLHEMFELAAVKLSGRELLARGPAWAMVSIAVVGLTLGVLVLLDAWRSRVSATALAIVALFYGGAAYFALFAPPAATMQMTMIASSVTLVAHLSLLVALLLYARHVLLEARGLIAIKPKKKRAPKNKPAKKPVKAKVTKAPEPKAASADDEDEDDEPTPAPEVKKAERIIKIDPPHNKPAQITSKSVATPAKPEPAKAKAEATPAKQPGPLARMIGFGKKPAETPPPANSRSAASDDDDDDDDDDDSSSGSQRLSKAEKRRLKKMKRREAGA